MAAWHCGRGGLRYRESAKAKSAAQQEDSASRFRDHRDSAKECGFECMATSGTHGIQ
jgi:hypothetical protein